MNATRIIMLLVLLGTWWAGSLSSAQEVASEAPAEAVEYMIVVTGGELLAGAFPDSHTVFLTRTLRPLGLTCVGSISVDDGVQDIQAALKFALARVRLVIACDDERLGWLVEADADRLREAAGDEARANVLAAGVAEHFHGDWSVAIGQLQRSSDGEPHIAVAIRSPDGQTTSHRVALRGTDPASRAHLTTRLLDLLRKRLQ